MSWKDGEGHHRISARLINISRGGAAIEVDGVFSSSSFVRIYLGGEESGEWIEAKVLGVTPADGGSRVRLKFRRRCAQSLLELVVLGRRPHRERRHRSFAGMESLEGRQLLSMGPVNPTIAVPAQIATPTPTLAAISNDTLLTAALYNTPNRMASGIAADGAVGTNATWESGGSSSWYIEGQRYGADFVQAGLTTGNAALVQQGWNILDWGFKKEAPDGSFPGTGDAFHSTSMFVEAGARALLLEVQTGAPDAAQLVAKYLPKINASAQWLTNPSVAAAGNAKDAPYTHRSWLLAAALGEVAALTHDPATTAAAEAYAKQGLALQAADGMNPEKGGGDVSYQAYGILLAERYETVCLDASLKVQIQGMIIKGLKWDETYISSMGQVSLDDSTRTGLEPSRSGTAKTIDYKTMVQAFSLATTLTGDPSYRGVAEAISAGRGWTGK